MGDEHRCLGQDVQLGNHLAYFHVGGDVLQAGGVDGAERSKDVDVQVPHCVKQDGVILGPVVEGSAKGGIQQRLAVVGGLPAAEGGPLADLYPGEHETVIESLVIGNQLFLHHDQVEVPVAVEDFLDGQQAAAIFFGIGLGQLRRGFAQRVVRRAVLEPGGYRVAVVGGVAGVEHDVGNLEVVRRDCAGNARKVVDDSVGFVVFQGVQHSVDVGSCLV